MDRIEAILDRVKHMSPSLSVCEAYAKQDIEFLLAEVERLAKDLLNAGQRNVKTISEFEFTQAENAALRREIGAAPDDIFDSALNPCHYCKMHPENDGNCDRNQDSYDRFSYF